MFDRKKIGPCAYEIPQEKGMKVPGLVIASEELLQEQELTESINQVKNVAYLPGIVGYSIAMPDIHWGYGFPIGGVAATDVNHGVISPGGVGYDINCGVRLATAPIDFKKLSENDKQKLIQEIYKNVPSGVGKGHVGKRPISNHEYDELLTMGAKWAIGEGYGFSEDLARMESHGVIFGADPTKISDTAKGRGRIQLGTIGSGNHFVEIGEIEQIFLPGIASDWNIHQGQTYILIHSGS
ncbi:MAG: RtcB family protein, partial [Chlamydiae bacterium]|nr:RtcB family protein [Chlamydiota bacterium]